ncbi:hypothetical protein K435DRAFT_797284 [Dendrothele bispora CBS 962.96]|uniref:FAD/NAD(P)-binding domain-containing protein n=1 Tax=Dendrothele bispora (strain CBS 962.96) TaxID=1314807 RepID=A0A4V4HFW8_DENBC|nr:hypothetical protein K435DRAFT_797284 [Dendrothele bispora CBS 962.96]
MKYYVPRFGVYRKDIGACTSAHNIAADCCLNGVGLYTEDTPPTDVADRMSASFPNNFMGNGISQRQTEAIAERGRGFKMNMGISGTMFSLLARSRPGGYYLDVGASQMGADGKIGLKNDSPISCELEDGSTMEADVVIFAIGMCFNLMLNMWQRCREKKEEESINRFGNRCTPIWRLDSDGEIPGTWRDLGVKGCGISWFYLKHIALQIKVMEEGLF